MTRQIENGRFRTQVGGSVKNHPARIFYYPGNTLQEKYFERLVYVERAT